LEKKRMYEERVREVEHGTFTPLVFSCTGGTGPMATSALLLYWLSILDSHIVGLFTGLDAN